MKVLSPAITCIVGSHMKPYLRDSLNSILAQTRLDVQIIVADSGQWLGDEDPTSVAMAAIYADFHNHPLIEWVTTGERPGLIDRKCPIAWVTNEVIRAGLIRGRYVCTFYDDDVYYPTFFERMAGHLDASPHVAVWCSQDRVVLRPDGTSSVVSQILALRPKTGPEFDCQVDGAQIMFRREALDAIGDPWLPEDPANGSCRHSDGIFLDRLGALGVVENIPETLLAHRFTPISTYTPS